MRGGRGAALDGCSAALDGCGATLGVGGSSRGVGLAEVLACRDARAAAQAGMAARQGGAILSLSLVSPGTIKDSPARRRLMDAVESLLEEALGTSGFSVLERARRDAATGPEALYAVSRGSARYGDTPAAALSVDALRALALDLKALAIAIEEAEVWGRLLDVDVLYPGLTGLEKVAREELGAAPRPCLTCARSARECMAERRHGLGELAQAAESLLRSFSQRAR